MNTIHIEDYLVSVFGPEQETTEINFCGQVYNLPQMGDEEFFDLFDEVVDHGIYLLESHEAKSLPARALCQAHYDRAMADHDVVMDAVEVEADRRDHHRRATGHSSLTEIYG